MSPIYAASTVFCVLMFLIILGVFLRNPSDGGLFVITVVCAGLVAVNIWLGMVGAA